MSDLNTERLFELAQLLNYACNEYIPNGYIQTQLQMYGVEALLDLRDIREAEAND